MQLEMINVVGLKEEEGGEKIRKKRVLVPIVIVALFTCLLLFPIPVEATIAEGVEEMTPELKGFIEILNFHLDIVLHNANFEFKIEGTNYLFSAENVRIKGSNTKEADGKSIVIVHLIMENCVVRSEDFNVSIDFLRVHLKIHVVENCVHYVVKGSSEVPLYKLILNAFTLEVEANEI